MNKNVRERLNQSQLARKHLEQRMNRRGKIITYVHPLNSDSTKNHFEVVCGNIGTVYAGRNQRKARKTYNDYCALARMKEGRASGESVSLFVDGNLYWQFHPNLKHCR